MSRAKALNAAAQGAVKACTGKNCQTSMDYSVAIQEMAQELATLKGKPLPKPEEPKPVEVEPKKVKHKFHMPKDMSVHVHEEPKPQTIQEKKEHKWDNLPRNVNFGECKDCKVKGKREKLHKKFKACDNCGANTLTKEDAFCPYCNKGAPEDGWEPGLDLTELEDPTEDDE